MTLSQLRRNESGQALPFVILLLFVLLGVVGLVLDGGMAYAQKRKMQNAADAAALAAGFYLSRGTAPDSVIHATAQSYGLANGASTIVSQYINAGKIVLGATGTGTIPVGTYGLQVQATYEYHPYFAVLFGLRTINVQAIAKSGVGSRGGNAGIITLGIDPCAGLQLNGGTAVRMQGGGIRVNARCSQALLQTGTTIIEATGGNVDVYGGYVNTGTGYSSPIPRTGVPPIEDPLRDVPVPDITAYPVRHGTPTQPELLHIVGSSTTILEPGIYFGGLHFNGSGTLVFMPGIYIIAGGEFGLVGSGTVLGSGVFFYITNDPWNPVRDGDYAFVNLGASGGWDLTPMTSGPYKNLTIFQDRANYQTVHMTGTGDFISGTLYFPKALIDCSGNGEINGTVQLIANYIQLNTGGIRFTYDGTKLYGMPTAVLIE